MDLGINLKCFTDVINSLSSKLECLIPASSHSTEVELLTTDPEIESSNPAFDTRKKSIKEKIATVKGFVMQAPGQDFWIKLI